MFNEEKVKSMTRAAAFENSEKKRDLEISKYFRSDYLGLQLIKSAIGYTVSFALLMVLWFMGSGEALMLKLSQPEFVGGLLKILVIVFVAGLCIYEIAVYIYCSRKYERAKERTGTYEAYLKEIYKFYEEESGADYTMIDLSDEESTL